MKTLTTALVIGTVIAAGAGVADAENGRFGRGNWRQARGDRAEIRQDVQEIRRDRLALRDAIRSGDRAAARSARRELAQDRRELRRDLADLRRDQRRVDDVDWREGRKNGPPPWAPAWGRRAKDERRLESQDERGWWGRWRDDGPSWRDRLSFWRGWR